MSSSYPRCSGQAFLSFLFFFFPFSSLLSLYSFFETAMPFSIVIIIALPSFATCIALDDVGQHDS